MKRLCDRSVLVQLMAGLACGLAALGAAGICVHHHYVACARASRRMSEDVLPSTSAAASLAVDIDGFRLREMQMLAESASDRAAARRELDASAGPIGRAVERLESQADLPASLRGPASLRAAWSGYARQHDALVALAEAGDLRAAARLFNGPMDAAFTRRVAPAARAVLQWDGRRAATLARQAAEQDRSRLVWSLAILMALSAAFAAGGLWFSLRLSRRLRWLSAAARDLAAGQLRPDGGESSEDEIGQVAAALASVAAYHDALTSVAERVAVGEMAVSIVPRSDDDSLSYAFVWMVNSLEVLMTEVAESRDRAVEWSRQQEAEKQKMTILLASIPSALVGIDNEGVVLQWNSAAEQILGVPSSEAVGLPLTECGAALDWEMMLGSMQACRELRSYIRLDDVPFHTPDGRAGLMSITLNPIQMGSRDSDGVLLQGSDITERRALESQLAQAQKLESIGQLAAGIAHEINTPTQFIADNMSFLGEAFVSLLSIQEAAQSLADSCRRAGAASDEVSALDDATQEADWEYLREEVPSAIQQSKEGLQRVAGIVQAMKEFSHPGVEAKVPFDLNHAIETTATVARHEWRYAADLQLALDTSLPEVPGYPGDINQVVLNLIVNAAHAVSSVSYANGGKGIIRLATRLDGDFAEIQVADTGPGIPEGIRHRVFDPFFTTKEVGKGTGQGLAIAHSVVVDKHGGTIRFETEDGCGTTFYVRLPLREAA